MSGRVRATPAVQGETAVVADFKGRVAAVKTTDGTVLWTQELKEPDLFVGRAHPRPRRGGLPRRPRLRPLARDRGEGVRRADRRARGLVSGGRGPARGSSPPPPTGSSTCSTPRAGPCARLAVAAEGIQSSPALDAAGVVIGSGRGLHAVRLTP